MKISLITVVYNGKKHISSCITSVLQQTYKEVEYIIIDGGSVDGTMEIVKQYEDQIAVVVSEPDKGIYDAMNKGLSMATGDVVGVLNSDDYFYSDHVLQTVSKAFMNPNTEAVFADLIYVDEKDEKTITRFYSGKGFKLKDFLSGNMPPHPTFYFKRNLLKKLGNYKTDYKICADYDLMLRYLYIEKINYQYIPEIFVTMRTGGVSTSGIRSTILVNQEIQRSCRENGFDIPLWKIYLKYFKKIWQLIHRPSNK